jgi:hypothetical protein
MYFIQHKENDMADKNESKVTSLERQLNAERAAGLEILRMLTEEIVKPLVPALVRSMDADTEYKRVRTENLRRAAD